MPTKIFAALRAAFFPNYTYIILFLWCQPTAGAKILDFTVCISFFVVLRAKSERNFCKFLHRFFRVLFPQTNLHRKNTVSIDRHCLEHWNQPESRPMRFSQNNQTQRNNSKLLNIAHTFRLGIAIHRSLGGFCTIGMIFLSRILVFNGSSGICS